MALNTHAALKMDIQGFRLPRYNEIPDVGLYLEQTTKYISECLAPFADISITSSMISNYVKKGLISSPIKKQYTRDQIAHLIYIAVVKNVLSLDDIGLMLSIQQRTYECGVAYNYFCDELENMLAYIFDQGMSKDSLCAGMSDEKMMLRNTIITVSHKVYLDKLFGMLHEHEDGRAESGNVSAKRKK